MIQRRRRVVTHEKTGSKFISPFQLKSLCQISNQKYESGHFDYFQIARKYRKKLEFPNLISKE